MSPTPHRRRREQEHGSVRARIQGVSRREEDLPAPFHAGTRLVVQIILAFAGAAALAVLLWPFLPALVTAGVLALILLPLHRNVLRVVPHRGIAAFASSILGLLCVVIPVFALGVFLAQELVEAAEWMAGGAAGALSGLPQLESTLNRLAEALGLSGLDLGSSVGDRLRAAPSFLAGRAFRLLAGAGGIAVQTGVALFTLYFLLRDEHRTGDLIRTLVPLDDERTDLLLARAREVVSAAVYGNVLVALTQGVLGGVAFWMLDLPSPALWGSAMAALSLVPLVGPGVIWAPAAIGLLVTGSALRGIILLAFGAVVISTVDNLIRAFLVSGRAQVHPLAIFLGVLGGLLTFGVVGIFVGPVLLVLSLTLLEMARMALYPEASSEAPSAAPSERASEPDGRPDPESSRELERTAGQQDETE